MQLSSIFHVASEEYLNIPSIKKFCKINKINLHGKSDKKDLITIIESYADSSDKNRETVLGWLDNVVQEGIKEIQIKYRELPTNLQLIFSNEKSTLKYLQPYLTANIKRHICGNTYSYKNYQLVKCEYSNKSHGPCVTLYFCKEFLYVETNSDGTTTRKIDFPIIADYYFNNSWLFIRYKPRTNLFYDSSDGYTLNSKRISMISELNNIDQLLNRIFNFDKYDEKSNSLTIKQKLYIILEKYTHTPAEISQIIKSSSTTIDNIAQKIIQICNTPLHTDSLKKDINNLVEKYLSITWPDKTIFTKDRDAYPIRLCAMDEESSRVDQTAGKNLPLQSREVFFDNKKMLEQQKYCDSIIFMWKRKHPEYYGEDFPVKISEKKGECQFKFSKFTEEEDIENVLFSIVDAQ